MSNKRMHVQGTKTFLEDNAAYECINVTFLYLKLDLTLGETEKTLQVCWFNTNWISRSMERV